MPKEYGFLINGEWMPGGKKREIRSPYNGETAGIVSVPDRKTAIGSVGSAESAYVKWRESPSHERSRILRKIAEGIAARKEEFARTLVLEGGKPLKTARVEVSRAVTTFSVAAEEANRFSEGELVPIDIAPGGDGMFGIARRFPLGVVIGISPFNFPLNLVAP